MCGRYALTLPPDAVRTYFRYAEQPNFPPRYNIAPTQPIAIVRLDNGGRHFALARWGFIPAFVRDMTRFALILNARAEGIEDKPSYRGAIRRRRCLIPADGFYEWRKAGRQRLPFLIRRPDRGLLAFGGIWETWHSADGSEMDTAAIITCEANGTLAALHDRMPVILDPRDFDCWLDPNAEARQVLPLMRPAANDLLEMVAVSERVNKATNEGPEVQEEAGGLFRTL
jgi:putative SOS response-associated peptidase YedK